LKNASDQYLTVNVPLHAAKSPHVAQPVETRIFRRMKNFAWYPCSSLLRTAATPVKELAVMLVKS
jgi:hypothetical protein